MTSKNLEFQKGRRQRQGTSKADTFRQHKRIKRAPEGFYVETVLSLQDLSETLGVTQKLGEEKKERGAQVILHKAETTEEAGDGSEVFPS